MYSIVITKVGTENFSDEEYDENTTYWDKRKRFWSDLRRELNLWDLKKPKLWKKNKSQIYPAQPLLLDRRHIFSYYFKSIIQLMLTLHLSKL